VSLLPAVGPGRKKLTHDDRLLRQRARSSSDLRGAWLEGGTLDLSVRHEPDPIVQ
jgi:hypothetical protein